MAQDLRELLRQDQQLPSEILSKGHEVRFLNRLEVALPIKETKVTYGGLSFGWLKIAASIAILFSITFAVYQNFHPGTSGIAHEPVVNEVVVQKASVLANISPEYKQYEDYYMSSIKSELAKLTINEDNKGLVDSFLVRLKELDKEYETLNTELLQLGTNETSIQALINNLQLRLELLVQLKSKLKTLKKLTNDTFNDQQI